MTPALKPRPLARLRAIPGGREDTASLSDLELFEAVADGDQRVASELYLRLGPVVQRTLYRIFGRREADHEDLVQAAFEQIVLTLAKRRYAQACSLKTWASTITANVALKALRSRRRERGVFDVAQQVGDEMSSGADIEHEVGVRQELDRLRGHLAELKPSKAEAVMLHDVLGHELAEIATITGCSVSAAQSRLVRGRHELAERMESDAKGRERR